MLKKLDYLVIIVPLTILLAAIIKSWEYLHWVAYPIVVLITLSYAARVIHRNYYTMSMDHLDILERRDQRAFNHRDQDRVDYAISMGARVKSIKADHYDFHQTVSKEVPVETPLLLPPGNTMPELVSFEELTHSMPNTIRQLVIGVGEDGQTITFDFTTLIHILVVGMSGSGKSQFVHSILTQLLLAREKVELDLIDLAGQTFTKYKLPYARTVEEAEDVIEKWNQEFERRRVLFEEVGGPATLDEYNNITGHDLPYTAVFIEEGAELFNDSEMIEASVKSLVAHARKYGLTVIFVSQSSKAKAMDTAIRGNFITRVQFPVQEKSHARMVVSNATIEELCTHGRGRIDAGYRRNLLFQGPLVTDDTKVHAAKQYMNRGGQVLDLSSLKREEEIIDLSEQSMVYHIDEDTGWPILEGTAREKMTQFAEYISDQGQALEMIPPVKVLNFYDVTRNGRNYDIWTKLCAADYDKSQSR